MQLLCSCCKKKKNKINKNKWQLALVTHLSKMKLYKIKLRKRKHDHYCEQKKVINMRKKILKLLYVYINIIHKFIVYIVFSFPFF